MLGREAGLRVRRTAAASCLVRDCLIG